MTEGADGSKALVLRFDFKKSPNISEHHWEVFNLQEELAALAELFMPIKLVPKQYDALVSKVRDALDRLRAQERAIMQLCVRDARMPRADFLRQFPNNETELSWADQLASGKSKYAEAIAHTKARLIDSRKTTPGLRALQEPEGVGRILDPILEAREGGSRRVPVLLKLAPELSGEALARLASALHPKSVVYFDYVERKLVERIGDAGRRLHTGRSRNEQVSLDLPPAPVGIPFNFEEHIKLMYDLMALAYQALEIAGESGPLDASLRRVLRQIRV